MLETRVLRDEGEKTWLDQAELAEEFFYFDPETVASSTYIAVVDQGTVVGLVAVSEDSLRVPGALHILFVETHADHRRRGVARLLVEGLFRFAGAQGRAIANSAYTPNGWLWLRPLMQSAAATQGVTLHER